MTNRSYRAAKEAYGEVKRRFNVTLTQSVVNFLDQKAEDLGLSRSELMERIFRSMILKDDALNWQSFADQEENSVTNQETEQSSSSRFEQPQTRSNQANFWLRSTAGIIGNLQ